LNDGFHALAAFPSRGTASPRHPSSRPPQRLCAEADAGY
jgi:hypothetical protein